MTRYVAFLRAVNVGGHTTVKTSDICKGLSARGFGHVSGYRQSGNVVLDSDETEDRTASEIREVIRGLTGKDVDVFLRTMEELRAMVRLDPFGHVPQGDYKTFVTFYSERLNDRLALPLKSPEGDAEIVLVLGREAFGIGYPKDGRYGASYGRLEVKLGKPFTTRNWNTIKGIAALPDR